MRYHSFDSCWAKIERADEQIVNLNREIESFLNEPPYGTKRVVYAIDQKARERAEQVHTDRDVPIRFGVLVGEILHNLRSALDHLANQLVIAAGNRPTGNTAFPIFTDDPAFDEKIASRYARLVKGIPPQAQAVIRQLQPYYHSRSDPSADWLAILAELCNRDKHRKLNLAVMATVSTSKMFFFSVPEDQAESNGSPTEKEFTVEVGGNVTVQVELDDPPVFVFPPLVEALEHISEHVRDVIAIFANVFPEPSD